MRSAIPSQKSLMPCGAAAQKMYGMPSGPGGERGKHMAASRVEPRDQDHSMKPEDRPGLYARLV